MLEKFDQFSNRKKQLDIQSKQLKKKMADTKKQKLILKMDKIKKEFSYFR